MSRHQPHDKGAKAAHAPLAQLATQGRTTPQLLGHGLPNKGFVLAPPSPAYHCWASHWQQSGRVTEPAASIIKEQLTAIACLSPFGQAQWPTGALVTQSCLPWPPLRQSISSNLHPCIPSEPPARLQGEGSAKPNPTRVKFQVSRRAADYLLLAAVHTKDLLLKRLPAQLVSTFCSGGSGRNSRLPL